MSDILELVGKRIRDIRKTKNLSQEQLGEMSGFHFTYILHSRPLITRWAA